MPPRVLAMLAVLAAWTLPPASLADDVYLKNGEKIEGTVKEGAKKGTYELRTGEGTTLVIPESDVLRIEKKRSPAEEFEERWKGLAPDDPDLLEKLEDILSFARDKGLRSRVAASAKRILEIDSNNALARKELGYVVYENRWILESELKKRGGLVHYQGEWMTEAEKERRLRDETRKEVEDLLLLAASDNAHVQEFSVRKVLAVRDPVARDVFAKHVRDPTDAVRWVAVRGLQSFPAVKKGEEEKRIALDLHAQLLEEKTDPAVQVIHNTMRRFYPEESFRLALETATISKDETAQRRSSEALSQLLAKRWVPDLCRAVAGKDGEGRKAVRDALRRSLGVDHGFDSAAWLRYWEQNASRFHDE